MNIQKKVDNYVEIKILFKPTFNNCNKFCIMIKQHYLASFILFLKFHSRQISINDYKKLHYAYELSLIF